MTSRKERVLEYLKSKDGWVQGHELTHPSVGGSEGLRRFRELRANGAPVTSRKAKGKQTHEYKYISDPKENVSLCSCMWASNPRSSWVIVTDDDCKAKPHKRVISNGD